MAPYRNYLVMQVTYDGTVPLKAEDTWSVYTLRSVLSSPPFLPFWRAFGIKNRHASALWVLVNIGLSSNRQGPWFYCFMVLRGSLSVWCQWLQFLW